VYGLVPQRLIDDEDEKLSVWKQDAELVSTNSHHKMSVIDVLICVVRNSLELYQRLCQKKFVKHIRRDIEITLGMFHGDTVMRLST